MKVNLRSASIKGGERSLYLDFYPPIINPDTQKHTRREFLGLRVYDKAKTPLEKNHNSETTSLAENIRARRQIEIQNGHYEFLSESKQNSSFIEYFEELYKKMDKKNQGSWVCTQVYLKKVTGRDIRFADLNVKFCNDFKYFLLKAHKIKSKKSIIAQNTAHEYFNCFKAALKKAYKAGLLKTDMGANLEHIKKVETERQVLSIEELNKLINTECRSPILKQAALFSALTGLRFSDIEKLKWSEVRKSNDANEQAIYTLHFTQKKTKGVEVLPISQQAFNLLGRGGNDDEKVLEGLHYSGRENYYLKEWILNAGIVKKITFHCFRHTYATLQLSLGTDLYTVSKMLGHRDIKTTQIYAKVMDKAKREATDKIQLDFSAA